MSWLSGGNLSSCGSGRRVTEYDEHAVRLHSTGPIACMGLNFCCQENNLWYQPCCCTRRSMQISIYTPRTHNGFHHAGIWQAVYPSSFPWAEIPILFASGAACVTRASGYVVPTGCPAARTARPKGPRHGPSRCSLSDVGPVRAGPA